MIIIMSMMILKFNFVNKRIKSCESGIIKTKYVWDITREERENDKLLNQLITYGNGFDNKCVMSKQDKIEKGIVPNETELEMLLPAV